MKVMPYLSLSVILSSLLFTPTYADSLYRQRIPLTVSMNQADKLYVTYELAEKSGIRCTTNTENVRIEFAYKGKEKSASLPILLINDHIPHNKEEALADDSGRFSLYTQKNQKLNGKFEVTCNYVESK